MSEQKAAIERNGEATLLVVDDEPEIVALLDEYFTGLGYRVLTAEDGATALKRAEQSPDLIVLDEPTTYLDISHQMETMQMVKRLNRETGVGVVMVLHDLSHALEVSDWIVVIKDGKKYSEGPPAEVITSKMLWEVYHVRADILQVNGRGKPLIAFAELT